MTQQPQEPSHETLGAENDPVMVQLKAMYDDVASEPLPDDLMKLLDQLDKAERNR